jgi:hypothetical protein
MMIMVVVVTISLVAGAEQPPAWSNDLIRDMNAFSKSELRSKHATVARSHLPLKHNAAATSGSSSNATSGYKINESLMNGNRPIFSYLGCFSDKRELRDLGDKDFTFVTKYNKSMPTVELCVYLCSQDGYNFAGVQA